MQLVRYEAACAALAACKSVDEVKTWADKAAAMQAYGRMAKDKTLEVSAAEIRIRAERRLGEMLAATKASGGLNRGAQLKGTTDGKSSVVVTDDRREKPTLADAGINKDLSSRAQKLAAVPDAEFESEVSDWRNRVNAEGARVSARLQKAGQRELDKAADPEPWDDEDAPSIEELEASERVQELQLDAMRRILEADDKLAEAMRMVKQRDAQIEQLQWRVNGLVGENAELIRTVKDLRKRMVKA